jgi:acyl-ACP thioesterase
MDYPEILEHNLKIYSYLVDDEMNLSMPALFGLIQEISSEHVNKCNIGWQNLRKSNLFWVLSKIHIKIARLPRWSEDIIIRTWGKCHDLLVNPRDYEMEDNEGNLMMKATSSWVILDAENGKIKKLDEFDDRLVYPKEKEDAITTRAPKVPKIDIQEECNFNIVLNSDIDMNKHVNNAHYVQWALDSVNQIFRQTHRLVEVVINYLSQAKLGDYYGIISKHIAENEYITSIFSKEGNLEFCRIQSIWVKQ